MSTFNKEFLIFLFFLILSGIFWLLMTLNETYERELTVDVQLTNVPKNVVITTEPPSVIRFTVRDKGYMIGGYMYGNTLHPIVVDFSAYANGKGQGSVTASDLQKQLYQQMYKSSKITAVKPDHIDFQYNFGRNKRVPIKLLGRILPAQGYYLSHTAFSPDSVTIYASKALLDSIKTVYTTPQQFLHFSDTIQQEVTLRKIPGVKMIPNTVSMTLAPDILTEETVEVPIEAINMPDDMTLRTFPSKVKVRFVVGAKQLRHMPKNAETKQLLPHGFRLVADYNDIVKGNSDKCRIVLRSSPFGIRNAKPEQDEVDYLIEQK